MDARTAGRPRMHVAILGSDLAGLAAAWELARAGVAVTVLEREGRVGGRAHTWMRGGHWLGFGAELFDGDDRSIAELREAIGEDPIAFERRTGALVRGRMHATPLVARAHASATAGAREASPALDAWSARRFERAEVEGVLAPIAENACGLPFSRIHVDWAHEHARSSDGACDGFALPARGGSGAAARALARRIELEGGDVRLCAEAVRFETRGARVLRVVWRREGVERALACDAVVTALPSGALARALASTEIAFAPGAVARPRAEHDAIVHAYFDLDADARFDFQRVDLADAHFAVRRVSALAARGDRARSSTVALCCEIPCRRGDATWRLASDRVAALAEGELYAAGLVEPLTVRAIDVVRASAPEPVFDVEHRARAAEIDRVLLGVENLVLARGAGPRGSMSRRLRDGRDAALALLTGRARTASTRGTP